jgi:hypothetical protein
MTEEVTKTFKQVDADPGFWGEVSVTYRAGKPVNIKLTKTTSLNKETPYYANNR